ncbi:MAG: glycerol-3-phosphate dehydrogenase/oxidase [Candidatus Omnitrophica bacterium]|nr:glycerol-3-phosphate dehydrogenase/oxidase [Candidatus Omnitrophota bacterium]
MNLRDELLTKLCTQTFDLLIIGGGIVGAGIARDAAMRGLSVALVEKGDVAGGASSKTSKLIHGGLRYLEHGQLRLVREGLRERRILRTIAPQYVWPLSLLLPIYRSGTRPRWKIAVGLALYDWFAASWNMPAPLSAGRAHRMTSAREALRLEAGLNPRGLVAAAAYSDCQMDDARLCLANVLQAMQFGAVCCNYVRVVAMRRARGRLCGAMVEDVRAGRQLDVQARVVVNATGPWSDAIRRLSDRTTSKRLAPTKGIHLVLPKLSSQALFFESPRDRRMIFLLPWGGSTLVGTTESAVAGDLDALRANDQEVAYLLEAVHHLLPESRMTEADVVGTFAGARPLLAFSGSSTQASREHQIEIDSFGLASVMGGKYTTYRAMAQQALDLVVQRAHLPAPPMGRRPERCLTDQISLLESAHPVVLNRWQDVTQRLDPSLMARLLAVYGTGAFRILEVLEFEPPLIQPLCPHHDAIQAELVYAMREELACTVSDLFFRRTKIAYSACQGLDALSVVADLLMRYGRHSPEEVEEQLDEYRRLLADSLAFRPAFASAV